MKSMFKSKAFWVAVLGIVGASAAYAADALTSGATVGIIAQNVLMIAVRRITSDAAVFFPQK